MVFCDVVVLRDVTNTLNDQVKGIYRQSLVKNLLTFQVNYFI